MLKQSKAETQRRSVEVMRQLVAGQSVKDIETAFSKKYNVSSRQVRNYLTIAREYYRQEFDEEIKTIAALQFNRYNDIYRKAIELNDLNNAIKALNSIDRITGLNKMQISAKVENDPFDAFFSAFGSLAEAEIVIDEENQ